MTASWQEVRMTRSGPSAPREDTSPTSFGRAGPEHRSLDERLTAAELANLVAFFSILAEWSAAELIRPVGHADLAATAPTPEAAGAPCSTSRAPGIRNRASRTVRHAACHGVGPK